MQFLGNDTYKKFQENMRNSSLSRAIRWYLIHHAHTMSAQKGLESYRPVWKVLESSRKFWKVIESLELSRTV